MILIVKRCIAINCKKYFPSKLGDHIPYCPECYPYEKEYMVDKIKSTRNIPIFYFDVFDSDYPMGEFCQYKYERVCRLCGARLLLKKNGKYGQQMRFCQKHSGDQSLNSQYLWNVVRYDYISELQAKHQTFIILTAMDQGFNPNPSIWNGRIHLRYCFCEKCNKLVSWGEIEVHHEIPVHTLTKNNFYLIWDKSNLICLCHGCHSGMDHKLKRSLEEIEEIKNNNLEWKYRNYKKISDFIQEGIN